MTDIITPDVPFYLSALFLALAVLLAGLSIWSLRESRKTSDLRFLSTGLFLWLIVVSSAAASGFYLDFTARPPHLLFLVIPPVLLLVYLAVSRKTPTLLGQLSLKDLTLIQSFRIVMEFILWLLVTNKAISPIMTFTGQNFDVFVGLTAPVVTYLYFSKKSISLKTLRAWNFAGIAILLVTVISGVLSAPTTFRIFHAEVSTAIIGTFPFALLPGFVVPFAFACHILSIRSIHEKLRLQGKDTR